MPKVKQKIRIGGASGFWGDAGMAAPQLLAGAKLDFLVFDYLAEITMAIMARMRAGNPDLGFATDFVSRAMAPNLAEIAQQGVRVISNAGGVNPAACAKALRDVIAKQGLSLKVAVVTGDDLMNELSELADQGHHDMFSGAAFPDVEKIGSVNAYLGAFAIAAALDRGADIVVTGRCVDSAVTLGACIHTFDWHENGFDLLAAGSLAGHILECGTQATGGNFTDWQQAGDMDEIGYPIAEISADGAIVIEKPQDSGGLVSVGTISEQMLYEIGDPQAYALPDVCCDFSQVEIRQIADNQVQLSGAKGYAPGDTYKTCLTWQDGFRGGHLFGFYGLEAETKAKAFATAALRRARASLRQSNMADFSQTSVEILGAESQFGAARQIPTAREVNAKIAVRHPDAKGVAVFLKEATGLALAAPPGLSGFAGARPKPSPVMALFSFLLKKDAVDITVKDESGDLSVKPRSIRRRSDKIVRPPPPTKPNLGPNFHAVPLIRLAFARSGDKGDSANIGVIARKPEFLPYIWNDLSKTRIAQIYEHFLQGDVQRFLLPGSHAMNILLSKVLGGGGTSSLRADPQGKGYAQLLLATSIKVPAHLPEPDL